MKRALITGGSGDIAIAISKKLASAFDVYRPNKEILDVTNLNNVRDYINLHGPFDLIINSAGSIHPKRLLESNEEKWVKDLMVNLIGVYYVSKKGLEQNQSAIIINIASTAAYSAYKDWGSYCCSKAGVVTFTKSMANDGFSSYAIAPGAVQTKFRNYFDLPNDNTLNPEDVGIVIGEILGGLYKPGDIIFYRKGEKKIL
ncbi:SDR family NAD(P)-dependent oxidoreductase [Flavobacterium phragmitis]|uniref:3-oxoacyl-[acyl-carrier protein] reductase n=1 Tax=Flavobacterium phragmitis TaxID=739143 RepID=A0A1I1NYX4_9FLAO|nr:SDR family oxidoreductase [Flavobacterium phragmitis]SFD00688.1 3-oxoacyl-[acyl-carrier protein] reductase [Flavobacterium phragmitis]